MRLEYIKANGVIYYPQKAGEQDPNKTEGCFYPVCYIKQISNGRWQVDYYDDSLYCYKNEYNNQKPASRVILYPSGIEEVKFTKEKYFD